MIVCDYITPNPKVCLQFDDRRWLIPYLEKIFRKDNIKDIKDIIRSEEGFFEIPLKLRDKYYFLSMDEEKYDCKVKIPIKDIKQVLEEKRIDTERLIEYVKNDIFNIRKHTEFILCLDNNYKTWMCLSTSIYKEKNVKEYIAKVKKTIPNIIPKCNEIMFNDFGRYIVLCDEVINRFKIRNPHPNSAFLKKAVICIKEELIEKYGFKKLS